MAVNAAYELLKERGYEPKRIISNEYIDCFCQGNECNVVRGTFILIIELADGQLAVFKYRSHTQTDCDMLGLAGDECDTSRMDVESLEFIGIHNSLDEIYSKVCPYGDYDDP